LYAQPDTAARNSALASALLPGAVEAYSLGFRSEAVELVDEALAFVPSHSDANYLRALYGLSSGEPLAGAMSRLETALAGASFQLVSPADARILYASLLVRTHRASDALRMMEGIPGGGESLYIESVARRLLGDAEGARAAVIRSMERYPHDPRPLLAWLRSAERQTMTAREASLVSAGFDALDSMKISDPDVLVELAPYAASLDETRYLIREYRAAGGASARGSLMALKYGLATEARIIKEFFSGVFPLTQEDIEGLYKMLSSASSRSDFMSAFAGFSGILLDDADMDGLPETVTSFARGAPTSLKHDPDQDGIPDMEIDFISGVPSTARAVSGSTRLELRFDPWPSVTEATIIDGSGSRRYRMAASQVSIPLVSLTLVGVDPIAGPYRVAVSREGLPAERLFAAKAYAVERTQGSLRETVELHDGTPQRAWWYDAGGSNGYSVYSRGVPSPETIDLDGDGRFESRRVWTITELGSVVPVYVETDLDSDGLYEYRERLQPPFVKSWDYDGDGAVDLTVEALEDNKLRYRLFGSGGPGGSVEVVMLEGQIAAVSENGRPVPLVGDSGGKVFWVGEKPFDFGARTPRPGYGVQRGTAYRVVVIGSGLYARVLR
jgi:hypothetical protein